MSRVSESLAGRAVYASLWPMTGSELRGDGGTGRWGELFEVEVKDWLDRFEGVKPSDWRARAATGGYPVPALELSGPEARAGWFDGYVRTYLERDLQELSAIDDLADYRRLMRAAALRCGGLENQAEIGRDIGVPRPTVHRWLNLLETSYQLVRLKPYSVNRTRRLVKSPRLFWSDTGLTLFLAGAEPGGTHLENVILTDLLAWRDTQLPRPEVLYWRTHDGAEVDLVIERGHELVAIEIKASRRPSGRDTRHIRTFRDEYPDRFRGGLLLHDGEDRFWADKDVLAVPWEAML
jgi:predicted AAA+ superfamily ATPase